MEKFVHESEEVPTMYVLRQIDGTEQPVRINRKEWDGKTPVSPQSHFVPEGYQFPEAVDEGKANASGGKTTNKPAAKAKDTGPKLVGEAKAWQGTAGLIYTQADDAGKFWRVDDKGVPVHDKPFDTDGEAAQFVIPA